MPRRWIRLGGAVSDSSRRRANTGLAERRRRKNRCVGRPWFFHGAASIWTSWAARRRKKASAAAASGYGREEEEGKKPKVRVVGETGCYILREIFSSPSDEIQRSRLKRGRGSGWAVLVAQLLVFGLQAHEVASWADLLVAGPEQADR